METWLLMDSLFLDRASESWFISLCRSMHHPIGCHMVQLSSSKVFGKAMHPHMLWEETTNPGRGHMYLRRRRRSNRISSDGSATNIYIRGANL